MHPSLTQTVSEIECKFNCHAFIYIAIQIQSSLLSISEFDAVSLSLKISQYFFLFVRTLILALGIDSVLHKRKIIDQERPISVPDVLYNSLIEI